MGLLTWTEKQDLIRAERERRRLIRLQQVRMLSREAAATIRNRVMKTKDQELQQIRVELTNAIRVKTPQVLEQRLSQRIANNKKSPASNSICPRKIRNRSLSAQDCEKAVQREQAALKTQRAHKADTARENAEAILRRKRARDFASAETRELSSGQQRRSNSN
ncbi:unnamed protein product, partial [Mesorhabditis belari]|uniref:Uncharacterized protein n=1 Tax=Mesorhabditis belari TaxID=2138241 RepID=A0AAF3J2S9_9BILA